MSTDHSLTMIGECLLLALPVLCCAAAARGRDMMQVWLWLQYFLRVYQPRTFIKGIEHEAQCGTRWFICNILFGKVSVIV